MHLVAPLIADCLQLSGRGKPRSGGEYEVTGDAGDLGTLLDALWRTAQCDLIVLMKRTLSVVGTSVLLSMMALMFLGGLLKKAARVVDGLSDPTTPPAPPPRPLL